MLKSDSYLLSRSSCKRLGIVPDNFPTVEDCKKEPKATCAPVVTVGH